MLKAIVAFGLTHRTIVIMGLLVFIAGGLIAFTELNIEAYPNPAPVILEITAQQAGNGRGPAATRCQPAAQAAPDAGA